MLFGVLVEGGTPWESSGHVLWWANCVLRDRLEWQYVMVVANTLIGELLL